jgi:LPS-assembly protein
LLSGAASALLGSFAPALAAGGDAPEPPKDMLLQADLAQYDTKAKVISAEGHVEIDYGGRILFADKVTYDQNTDIVTADGHVSVLDPSGGVAFATHVVLTDKLRDGALTGFGVLMGKNGRMVASSAERKEGRYTIANNVAYTPCKICNEPGKRTPVWQIKATRVVHDQLEHRIKFTDAKVELFGVPVFYSPILTEPDPTVHHASGLLLPDIGSSSANGYFISLPYYWSLSKSQDATVQAIFTTKGGQVGIGEYRQRWNQGGMWLQGSLAHNPNGGIDQDVTQYYSHLFGAGRVQLTDRWKFGYDAQITSNDTYLKRYDLSQQDRLVSDLFFVGDDGQSRFAITGYFFQGLRASDNNKTFAVPLPLIEYTYIPVQKFAGGRFRLDINTVSLFRQTGDNDQRLTGEASWRLPLVTQMGQLWTFQLDARGDIYHTDSLLSAGNHYKFRGLPYVALDWRWPFIASRGNGHSIILEPVAQLIAQPYGGNLSGIPNEDSLNIEIDDNNLLSFEQVPGYDLAASGPRANFGFRAETRFESGYAEALVGQAFRLKEDPKLAAVPGGGFSGERSDLVGRFSLKFPPYLDLTNRLTIDERNGNVYRDETYVTATLGRSSARISYVQLSPTLGIPGREEVNAQMDINFYRNWQGFAAIRRDLKAGQTLNNEFGIGYEDECLGISVSYRRRYTADRDLPPSTTFPFFRFKVKTTDEPTPASGLFPQDVFSYGHS